MRSAELNLVRERVARFFNLNLEPEPSNPLELATSNPEPPLATVSTLPLEGSDSKLGRSGRASSAPSAKLRPGGTSRALAFARTDPEWRFQPFPRRGKHAKQPPWGWRSQDYGIVLDLDDFRHQEPTENRAVQSLESSTANGAKQHVATVSDLAEKRGSGKSESAPALQPGSAAQPIRARRHRSARVRGYVRYLEQMEDGYACGQGAAA